MTHTFMELRSSVSKYDWSQHYDSNTTIGNDCKVLASVLEGAVLEDDVDMGPFALKERLKSHVHMGNFGEVKDSTLHEGVKMGHFSYIGNTVIGAYKHWGLGPLLATTTAEEHPTEIGEDAFIGSDTMLVAPLKLGDGRGPVQALL